MLVFDDVDEEAAGSICAVLVGKKAASPNLILSVMVVHDPPWYWISLQTRRGERGQADDALTGSRCPRGETSSRANCFRRSRIRDTDVSEMGLPDLHLRLPVTAISSWSIGIQQSKKEQHRVTVHSERYSQNRFPVSELRSSRSAVRIRHTPYAIRPIRQGKLPTLLSPRTTGIHFHREHAEKFLRKAIILRS